MPWAPHITVAAIAERDGRFLMVEEEADGSVVFNQPAGHLEPGETLTQAVVREVREETAWDFEPECLLGVYLYPTAGVSYLRFCFAGRCTAHHPGQALDQGILRAPWLSREEIAATGRLRSPLVLNCIDDYLAGRRYPVELVRHVYPR